MSVVNENKSFALLFCGPFYASGTYKSDNIFKFSLLCWNNLTNSYPNIVRVIDYFFRNRRALQDLHNDRISIKVKLVSKTKKWIEEEDENKLRVRKWEKERN